MSITIENSQTNFSSFLSLSSFQLSDKNNKMIYKDTLSLSSTYKEYLKLPSGFSFNRLNTVSGKTDFNFSIQQNNTFNFDLQGYYSSKSSEFSMKVKTTFEQIVNQDGNPEKKSFEVSLEIISKNLNSVKSNKRTEKQDIMEFINKIFRKIFQILNDKKKKLDNVIFDVNDLKELLSDKKGNNLNGFLLELQALIKYMERMKDLKPREGVVERVLLIPKREETDITETEYKVDNDLSVKVNISEVKDTEGEPAKANPEPESESGTGSDDNKSEAE